MRLRYLHLPDYGVLKHLRVSFAHETILERQGDLHFVEGLNGTGKSSLLRALFELTVEFAMSSSHSWKKPGAAPLPMGILNFSTSWAQSM